MPVFLVKYLSVSFWMSTICGLLTISTFSESFPPPVPPQPAQPVRTAAATATAVDVATVRASERALRCRCNIRYLQDASGGSVRCHQVERCSPAGPGFINLSNRGGARSHHAVSQGVAARSIPLKRADRSLIRSLDKR